MNKLSSGTRARSLALLREDASIRSASRVAGVCVNIVDASLEV